MMNINIILHQAIENANNQKKEKQQVSRILITKYALIVLFNLLLHPACTQGMLWHDQLPFSSPVSQGTPYSRCADMVTLLVP